MTQIKKKYRVILWDHILDTGRNVNNIKKKKNGNQLL